MVEDSEQDAQLLLRHLRRSFDVTHTRVDSASAMSSALKAQSWDVVLSDYSLPSFDAPQALATMHEHGLDLPFIIVSGTVAENVAVRTMRAGAHDYFLKGELGERLIAAIEREMQEASIRAENLRMQEQLMVSDCMASMGTLAAGIAHEINNPLASVMVNLDLAMTGLSALADALGNPKELEEISEEFRDAREGAERIRSIVRDLKIFSRPQAPSTGPVDVQKVMDSTLRMAWTEIRHRARLVKNYGNTPRVNGSEGRIGQVFLNLVVNAAQAIAEGHSDNHAITITTGTDEHGWARIEIADTGPGISEDVQRNLFNPFFTTKPVGVGTGLGLSICRRIVADLGGSIDVDSELGKGAIFRVGLPPASVSASEEEASPGSEVSSHRRARILVIDDEPMIGKAVTRALANQHEVIPIRAAEEALSSIREGQQFDIILCDLLMPQMTGMDFYEELLRDAPAQGSKVIFLTGGAFTPRAHSFLNDVKNPRIEKPFDPFHLRALVNDRLR